MLPVILGDAEDRNVGTKQRGRMQHRHCHGARSFAANVLHLSLRRASTAPWRLTQGRTVSSTSTTLSRSVGALPSRAAASFSDSPAPTLQPRAIAKTHALAATRQGPLGATEACVASCLGQMASQPR